MVDWNGLAAEKYAIEQQRADAAQSEADANAHLNAVRAALMPGESAAQNALQGAMTRQHNTTADLLPTQAASENSLRSAQAGYYGAESQHLGFQETLARQMLSPELAHAIAIAHGKVPAAGENYQTYGHLFSGGQIGGQGTLGGRIMAVPDSGGSSAPVAPASAAPVSAPSSVGLTPDEAGVWNNPHDHDRVTPQFSYGDNQVHISQPGKPDMAFDGEDPYGVKKKKLGLSTGTSKVDAPGDGTVDTVNAKLANGEAVLNRAAAEHLGRGFIEALNQAGAMAMGLDESGVGVMGQDKAATNEGGTKVASDDAKAHGYAKGTAKVPGKGMVKGKGKAPAKGAVAKGKAPADPNAVLQRVAQMARQSSAGMP